MRAYNTYMHKPGFRVGQNPDCHSLLSLLRFLSPLIEAAVIYMSQLQQHWQGLQIPGGASPGKLESCGWIGTFIIREAILLCPDNLNTCEQYIYYHGIDRIVVRSPCVRSKFGSSLTLFYRESY